MVCIFLADGFEMIETLTPCDILCRAGLDVRLVSVNGKEFVRSTHGVDVKTDLPLCKVDPDSVDMMILPGGMPGAKNLYESKALIELLLRHAEEKKPIGAICAAPFILGKCGLLKGKKATCYPGFEDDLLGATVLADGVARDGNIVTAKGMGVSLAFSLALCELLCGKEKRDAIAKAIMMA
ncbi:MAG: DJ-1/PfpI family protein [Clostridia bacterium]|nr:DJ-1/PfpI family protein [Clostridia bacterium]